MERGGTRCNPLPRCPGRRLIGCDGWRGADTHATAQSGPSPERVSCGHHRTDGNDQAITAEHAEYAEFLTADYADNADKGRRIPDYPRYLCNPRLNVLVDPLACPSEAGCGIRPRCELSGRKSPRFPLRKARWGLPAGDGTTRSTSNQMGSAKRSMRHYPCPKPAVPNPRSHPSG